MDGGEGGGMGSMSSGGGVSSSGTSVGAGSGANLGSGFDTGFSEQASTVSYEETSVFENDQSFDNPDLDLGDQTSFEEFVSTPGTPHDKLSLLSQMADEQIIQKEKDQLAEENEAKNDNPTIPDQAAPAKDYMNKVETDEQKLIRLQQETLKMVVGMMSGGASAKDREKEMKEMIAQLKALLEKLAAQGGEKGGLAGSAVNLMLLLLTVGAQAEQKLQKEVETA